MIRWLALLFIPVLWAGIFYFKGMGPFEKLKDVLPVSEKTDKVAGEPKYIYSYQAALQESAKTKKPVVLIFSASWCPPCQANKKKVYPSKEVAQWHDKFVWAYLDVDKAENKLGANKHRVSSIPQMEILSPEGKTLMLMKGGTTATEFASKLKQAIGR